MIRKHWPVAGIALALVLGALACDGGYEAAQVFKGEASKRITAFTVDYAAWDKAEQARIRDAAEPGRALADVDAFVARVQAPVRKAVAVLKGALAAFVAGLEAYARGVKADWLGLGLTVVRSAAELIETLKQLGVSVAFSLPAFFGGL